MAAKVYIETSVVSYLTARLSRDLIVAGHQQLTQEWWDTRRAEFELFASEFVVREAGGGDERAAGKRLETLAAIPLLVVNEEALALARELIDQRTLPETAADDAAHIAVATVHGMDYLLTWNCRHLANAEIRRSVNVICQSKGYEPLIICTPEELMGDRGHD